MKTEEKKEQVARQGLVPKLRFPEFRDAGDWEERRLSSVIQLLSGVHLSPSEYDESGYTPYFTGPSDFTNQISKVSKWTDNSSHLALEQDILITVKGSGVGELWYLLLPSVAMGRQLMAIRADKCISKFIYQMLSTKKSLFEALGAGNMIPGLSRSDILSLTLRIPSLIEQQKIADCLTSLDELITAQAHKLEALKTHKKGMMQKLFPAPGKTTPELRFPEFRDAGEWESYVIRDFAKVTTGSKDTQNKVDKGNYPFFVRSQIVERINSFSYDGEAILTSGDGVGVGKNFHYINGKFDFHQRVYCIYDFTSKVLGKFVFQYFSKHFYQRVMQLSAKNSVDSVRIAMVAEMQMGIPSLPEQQKIADCLSSIDELIAAQTDKIDTLKAHKKGLMQQLFPNPDEVEG